MDTFDPVKYSREENEFLLENVGLSPAVALSKPAPVGVNPRAVRPILQEVYDREELRTQRGLKWVGVGLVKDAIQTFLSFDKKWEADHQRSRGRIPRFPSLFVKDGKGKYHKGASGSDSSFPVTWSDAEGNRRFFALELSGDELEDFTEILPPAPKKLIHDEAKNRIECPICAHAESYKPESRSSYNAARARMSRHLKRPNKELGLHRELHTNEFGG